MCERIKKITQWDNPRNEDYVFAGPDYSFVIDGATGLAGQKTHGGQSIARWFSQQLGIRLSTALGEKSDIADVLHAVLCGLAGEYRAFSGEDSSAGEELAPPSASITIARHTGDFLELYQLGDCTAIIKKTNGGADVWSNSSIAALDAGLINRLKSVAEEKNISVRAALPYIRQGLLENRARMNTPEGYWILDLSGKGIYMARRATYPLACIHSVAIMSDGFGDMVDTVPIYKDYAELTDAMERLSLSSMVDSLYQALDADPEFMSYPRFKPRDDASAVWELAAR